MAQLIMVDGTIKNIVPNNGESFSLDEMQAFVGGNIEHVDLAWLKKNGQIDPDIEDDHLIVNEEGKLRGLPINRAATSIVAGLDIIVGPALLCNSEEFK